MKVSTEFNLIVQCSSLILTLIFNSILIYLILTKSPKKMGNYKILMIYFSAFSIIFAITDIIVRPSIHNYKSSFFMVMSLKNWPFSKGLAEFFIGVLCGCGGVLPCLIAIHFIYRFFAIERKGNLKYFSGNYLILWFLIPILGGINWFQRAYFDYAENNKTSEYIKEGVFEMLGFQINETVYSASVFYPPDENGVPQLDMAIFRSYIILSIGLAIPFSVMLIFGWLSHGKIKNLMAHGECEYTKRLQLQLYRALIVQTILPISIFFIPFGTFFTAPLLHVDIGSWSYITTFLYAIYPAVDSLPTLFIVQEYRKGFNEMFDVFRCSHPSRIEDSSIINNESLAV